MSPRQCGSGKCTAGTPNGCVPSQQLLPKGKHSAYYCFSQAYISIFISSSKLKTNTFFTSMVIKMVLNFEKKNCLNIWYISWIQTRTEGEDNRSTIKWFRCAFFLWGSYWTCITPSSKVWICSNFLCSIPCSPFGSNKCVSLRPHIWEKPLSFGTCSFYPADILHMQYTPCSLSLLILFGENMPHYRIEIVYYEGFKFFNHWSLSLVLSVDVSYTVKKYLSHKWFAHFTIGKFRTLK